MDQEVRPATALDRGGARSFGLTVAVAALGSAELVRFAVVVGQLALALCALYLFRIEESVGFPRLLPVIFIGFIVHAGLPLRLRRLFFLLLSVVAIGVIFGVKYGAVLVALGLAFVTCCHLPIAFRLRIVLIVAMAAVLAAVRLEWLPSPGGYIPTLVLPILGSMFMFRLIVYLYDLRHEKVSASWSERLSYFFMLPNVCFPLFPVVDYQMYRRTYYDSDPITIYQKGVLWIVRGLLHLVLYRVVYHFMVPSPAEVQGLSGVVQAMVSTYLLYLRISGQFHLIVGILCLFGFNLPETHRLYYLASSFNDYWRRINIYWKDFMMKIFYYPSLMYLRRWGMTTAMVGATMVVFAGTWLLHSYQWLWLRGAFPLRAPDMLFWGILGLLVVANSLWEAKRGRTRSLAKPEWKLRGAVIHAVKTLGMFMVITVLWSLWSSTSVEEWLSLVSALDETTPREVGIFLLALVSLVAIGALAGYASHRGWSLTLVGERPSFRRSATFVGATALILVLVGAPQINSRLGGSATELLAAVQQNQLNARDAEALERGYYEGLLSSDQYTSALALVSGSVPRPPDDWEGLRQSDAVRSRGDFLDFELVPMYDGTLKRALFRTNEWGMRDGAYTLEKPAGTYRIALLGASHTMGVGVKDAEVFETIVEERLNRGYPDSASSPYQILNFAVGGYAVHHSAVQLREKVLSFDPDMVIYSANVNEGERVVEGIAETLSNGVAIPYPELSAIVERSGARRDMKPLDIERRLYPFEDELLAWSFRSIVQTTREHGALPIWLYVPLPDQQREKAERREELSRLAQSAGFTTWSIHDAYAGQDETKIWVAEWDKHPNAWGHRLLADRLHSVIEDSLVTPRTRQSTR